MIIKGAQRGGGKQLALHLLNARDNEHVQLHDLKGFVSDDLVGAMKEAYAVSKGTRCKQFLFSVSLNPPPAARVPVAAFEDALSRIEKATGLAGQPRAVVFHEKEGRRHCHAVYSRIDAGAMRAITLSHYKLKLRDISRSLYLEQGWQLPKGLMDSRARDPRAYTLAEYQQARRIGTDAGTLKAMMAECWATSDSRAAFARALQERGFTLARGERRGHVAVSPEGEVLSVARYTGKRAKEVRARLGEPDALPPVGEARAAAAAAMESARTRHIAEARRRHRDTMAPLEARRRAMTQAHRAERQRLAETQAQRRQAETLARSQRLNSGLRGLWDRVTGRHGQVQRRNRAEAQASLARDAARRQALIDAQLAARRRLQAEIQAVRDAQADLLRDLRTDRQHSRTRLEALREPAAAGAGRAARKRAGPTPRADSARSFDTAAGPEAAKPPESSRLRRLRRDRQAAPPPRGPERER